MMRRPSRTLATWVAMATTTSLLMMLTTTTTVTHSFPLEMDFSVIGNDQTPRSLQTSGGPLPDLGASTQACDALGGTRFYCDIFQKVGYETDFMNLNISIECYLDTTTGFDFRRASGCTCSTLLTPSNTSRLPKTCPCYVCPMDFGSSSVSIDCSYLIPNATETASDVPSATPSSISTVSPTSGTGTGGGGMGGTTSSPTAAPSVSKAGSTTTSAPVMGTGGGGGGQGMPVQPTGSPVTTAPSAAGSSGNAAPTSLAPQQTVQRNRNVQTTTTSAPSPSAPLVTNSTNSTATNTTNATTVLPDPYIFNTCVSVDCGGNCNGTCSLGCDDPTAATLCKFCEGAAGSPTPGPTGSDLSGRGGGNGGTDNVPTIGTTSGAATQTGVSRSGAIAAAVIACAGAVQMWAFF